MKRIVMGIVMGMAVAANAGLWEGLTEENYICGQKLTEREILGKVVVQFVVNDTEECEKRAKRAEELWKSHDKKRFVMIGSVPPSVESKEAAVKIATKLKLSFPIYKGFRLASDSEKQRTSGAMVAVNQYGKIVISLGQHDNNTQDFEQFLVEAITEVGMPPNLIPGVELNKYKSLKTKLQLGKNLKGVMKQLEKDVAAAEKKTATAVQKAKAEEAGSLLSAIKEGKETIYENITSLIEVNPEEAYKLLALYVKSFPDEAADNKEKLAELKVKAAEFKKSAPKK